MLSMETLISVVTELSSIIGVPAAICLAWAAFVIRDHSRRIEKLEDKLDEIDNKRNEELSKIYDKINAMSADVAFIKGKFSGGHIPVQGPTMTQGNFGQHL